MKIIMGALLRLVIASSALLTISSTSWPATPFYAGKTIKIIVGFGPGGGYDLYARLIGEYIGRYIPGRPFVVVENMVGAGSLTATNYVYGNAPQDGTVLGAINQNIPMDQLLGMKDARYQPTKFNWIGSAAHSSGVIYSWHTSKVKTLDDAKKRPIIIGGTGTSADSYIYPTVINYLIGTQFKVINGYKGSADVRLAIQKGEVEGRFDSWASLTSGSDSTWIRDHKINLLIQIGLTQQRGAPDVPLLINLVKGEKAEQIARLISTPSAIGYTLFAAPGVPHDRVEMLRKAFDAAMKDPELIADSKSRHILLTPTTGAQLEKIVASTETISASTREKTKAILGWR